MSEENPTWFDQAACKNEPTDLWFPDKGESRKVETTGTAIAICDSCPVKADCLDYAVSNNIGDGIFGGLSPKQRRPHRRAWLHANPVTATGGRRHGLRSTYVRGCRCVLCTTAERSYQKERKRRDRIQAAS